MSLSPSLAAHFRFLAPYLQFAYRLTGHANAALLVAVFASGTMVARKAGYVRHKRETRIVLAVALIVAAAGLGVKLIHGAAVKIENAAVEFDFSGPRDRLVTDDFSRLGWEYSTPARLRELSQEEAAAAIPVALPVRGNRGQVRRGRGEERRLAISGLGVDQCRQLSLEPFERRRPADHWFLAGEKG